MEICNYKNNCNGKDCDKSFCLKKYKLDLLYKQSLLPEKQKQKIILSVDDDQTDLAEFRQLSTIEKSITDFVAEGKNLYLHSAQVGNGKSSWAIRMLQAYFNSTWPKTDTGCCGLYISVPQFLLALKAGISKYNEYAEYIKENVLEADIVIWDEIAEKVGTEFELTYLLSLIEARILAGKTNIYTSNATNESLYETIGERLASRICNYSINIELKGKDKRQINNGMVSN